MAEKCKQLTSDWYSQAGGAGGQVEPLPALPVEVLEETHRRMAQALTRHPPRAGGIPAGR